MVNATDIVLSKRGVLFTVGTLEKHEYELLLRERFIPRLFDNDFLERTLTTTPPALVVLVWTPLILHRALALTPIAVGFVLLGILIWGAIEYCLHRFVFHMRPTGYWTQTIHFALHGIHHVSPRDPNRLVFPLPLSLLVYKTVELCFCGHADALLTGGATGYFMYDMLHCYVHRPGCRLAFLKRNHILHHYNDTTRNFGVSPPAKLFDYLLGTHLG